MKALFQELDSLTASGEMSKEKEARMNYLLAAIKHGKKANRGATLTPELRGFVKYLATGDIAEYRSTFLAGTQSITSNMGPFGGYLCPVSMQQEVFEAMAQ